MHGTVQNSYRGPVRAEREYWAKSWSQGIYGEKEIL